MTRTTTHGPSTVHKFEVAIVDEPTAILLPPSARIIHVARQNGGERVLQLWALVPVGGEVERAKVERRFMVHGTGHPIPGGREHVGTVIDGPFVWHVFEDVAGRA